MFSLAQMLDILPELVLFVGALAGLMIGVFSEKRTLFIYGIGVILLALGCAISQLINGVGSKLLFADFIQIDAFVVAMRIFILGMAAVLLMILSRAANNENLNYFEFPILFICCVIGSLIMCLAHDLLILYVGLELQSLSLYVLISAKKKSVDASEASLKYFILGAIASGFLLFGIALCYGFCGSTNYEVIESLISNHVFGTHTLGLILALLFLIVGFAFKLSLAPFHMWLPDVYGGSHYGTILLVSILPKLAAFFAFAQLLTYPLYGLFTHWKFMIFGLSILSLAWSAFAGLVQKNLKRLLAYSGIGNIGFLCLGLSSGSLAGVSSSFYYLVLYTITLVLFFGLIIMSRTKNLVHLSDFAGFGKAYPMFSFFLAALVFSFAGVPPLPGFFAKLAILKVLITEEYYVVAVIAVTLSVISVAYYLAIIRAIYMDEPQDEIIPLNFKKSKLLITVLFGAAISLAFLIVKPQHLRNSLDTLVPNLFGNQNVVHQAAA